MPWSNARPKYKTAARGYDKTHQKLRARWVPLIAAGGVNCFRCGKPILPGMKWHLDHLDDRSGYGGPSHASCNLTAGARKGRRMQGVARPKRATIVDSW